MNRMVQLDALRAFAVMGVILYHSTRWRLQIPLGPYGVRLFFVLSGYLITGILLRAREAADDQARSGILLAFYARRFLRIFPIFYVSLAVLWLLGQPSIRETIAWHACYLSNFLIAFPPRNRDNTLLGSLMVPLRGGTVLLALAYIRPLFAASVARRSIPRGRSSRSTIPLGRNYSVGPRSRVIPDSRLSR